MELRHARYFLAVAEELNFTRAAARVGIGQPPLSQQIRALERELGAPLFHRIPQGAELTEAGQAFLPEARALLAQAERAINAARRGARGELGRLRIGFASSASFLPIVPTAIRMFRRSYPEVELALEEAHTTGLLARLGAEELDAVFIRLGPSDPEEVKVQDLCEEPMVIALPSSHPQAKAKVLPLAALANEPLLLFPRQAGPSFFDGVIAACRRAGFEPMLGQEAPQFSSMVNLVAAEWGVSLVPASMAKVGVAGVAYVAVAKQPPTARLALATRRGERSATVKNFCALVAAQRQRTAKGR